MIAGDDEFVKDLKKSMEEDHATDIDEIAPTSDHPSLSPIEKAKYVYEEGNPIWDGITEEKVGKIASEAIHKNNYNGEEYSFKLMLADGVPFLRSNKDVGVEINHPNVDFLQCAVEYIVGNKISQIKSFTKEIYDGNIDDNPRDWVAVVRFDDLEGNEGEFYVNNRLIYGYNYDVISKMVPDMFGIELPEQLKEIMTEYSVCIYEGSSSGGTESVLTEFHGLNWDYISDDSRYCEGDLTYLINFDGEVSGYTPFLNREIIEDTFDFLNTIINMNIEYDYMDLSPSKVELDKLSR